MQTGRYCRQRRLLLGAALVLSTPGCAKFRSALHPEPPLVNAEDERPEKKPDPQSQVPLGIDATRDPFGPT